MVSLVEGRLELLRIPGVGLTLLHTLVASPFTTMKTCMSLSPGLSLVVLIPVTRLMLTLVIRLISTLVLPALTRHTSFAPALGLSLVVGLSQHTSSIPVALPHDALLDRMTHIHQRVPAEHTPRTSFVLALKLVMATARSQPTNSVLAGVHGLEAMHHVALPAPRPMNTLISLPAMVHLVGIITPAQAPRQTTGTFSLHTPSCRIPTALPHRLATPVLLLHAPTATSSHRSTRSVYLALHPTASSPPHASTSS